MYNKSYEEKHKAMANVTADTLSMSNWQEMVDDTQLHFFIACVTYSHWWKLVSMSH